MMNIFICFKHNIVSMLLLKQLRLEAVKFQFSQILLITNYHKIGYRVMQ
jgi:hypothetical protein